MKKMFFAAILAASTVFAQDIKDIARRMDATEASAHTASATALTQQMGGIAPQMDAVLSVRQSPLGYASMTTVMLRSTRPIGGKLIARLTNGLGESMTLASWDMGSMASNVMFPLWTGDLNVLQGPATFEVINYNDGRYSVARAHVSAFVEVPFLQLPGIIAVFPDSSAAVILDGVQMGPKGSGAAMLDGISLKLAEKAGALILWVPAGACLGEGEKPLTVCISGECATRTIHVPAAPCSGGKG